MEKGLNRQQTQESVSEPKSFDRPTLRYEELVTESEQMLQKLKNSIRNGDIADNDIAEVQKIVHALCPSTLHMVGKLEYESKISDVPLTKERIQRGLDVLNQLFMLTQVKSILRSAIMTTHNRLMLDEATNRRKINALKLVIEEMDNFQRVPFKLKLKLKTMQELLADAA